MMRRSCYALLLAFGLVSCIALDAAPAAATTYQLNIDGALVSNGDPVHATIVMDADAPDGFNHSGNQPFNMYHGTAVFSFTVNGVTTSSSGAGLFQLGKGLDSANGYAAAPYDLFEAVASDALGNVLFFGVTSLNTNTALALLTTQTLPLSLAAWESVYGTVVERTLSFGALGALPNSVQYGLNQYSYYVTNYTIAATPIPASLLMFGTALTGLVGFVGLRNRRHVAARAALS
jgi:hypothetical protein